MKVCLQFDQSGKLSSNPTSWNKLAHVLYIESPVETGFSYTTNYSRSIDDNSVFSTFLTLNLT